MDEAPLRSIGNLADSAPLWRYIRLSSLLNLLNGNVFVPTIKTLQEQDPNEAATCCKATQTCFQTLSAGEKQMLLAYGTKQEQSFIELNPGADHWQSFASIWLRELANRRCVWCWYHGNIESMAQWHIYARDGVAIRTNPQLIRRAFSAASVDRGIMGSVIYDDEQRTDELLFLRPYLQKQKCYQHEQEVRVVFPREPGATAGTKFPIDGRTLVDAIMLSPLFPADEARELTISLNNIVNRELGREGSEFSRIPIYRSIAKVRLPRTPFDFSMPDPIGITNFGRKNMPRLFCDDILREYEKPTAAEEIR